MSCFLTSLLTTASPANLESHTWFDKAGGESGTSPCCKLSAEVLFYSLQVARVLAQSRTTIRKLVACVSVVFSFWMSCRTHFGGGSTYLLLFALQVVQEGSTLTFNEIKRCVSPHCWFNCWMSVLAQKLYKNNLSPYVLKLLKKKWGRIVMLSSLARDCLSGNDLKTQTPSFSGVKE